MQETIINQLRAMTPALRDAVGDSSTIGGWRGRAAHHLLAAVDLLVLAAVMLLSKQAGLDYTGEKMRRAAEHLRWAAEEIPSGDPGGPAAPPPAQRADPLGLSAALDALAGYEAYPEQVLVTFDSVRIPAAERRWMPATVERVTSEGLLVRFEEGGAVRRAGPFTHGRIRLPEADGSPDTT